MFFSEANQEWSHLPEWAKFLIRFGYDWPRVETENRRIALISMPCDSAGAALVTVGAMIRDLCDPKANDIDGHYARLLLYARQYLQSCRPCDTQCRPELKRCGYTTQATGKLNSVRKPHNGYWVSDVTDFETRQIAFERQGVLYKPFPEFAINYYIHGEPPPHLNTAEGELWATKYTQLIETGPFHAGNLRTSYSGLCLAGRAGGGNASREVCASVRFRDETGEYGLEDLLTIHDWSDTNISRVAFFNARTGEFDRNVSSPRLVVADGDASFLKVVGQTEFHRSDIVGVIHRIVERDRLEALGNKISDLRQWYVQDEDMLLGLPEVPRGMSISILMSVA